MKPTGEEILRASWPKRLQPSFNGVSCLLRDLELDWSTGLPLNDRCPLPHLCSRADLVQAKFNQVARAKLAVDGQVKEREVAPHARNFEPNANGPNVLWLEFSGRPAILCSKVENDL